MKKRGASDSSTGSRAPPTEGPSYSSHRSNTEDSGAIEEIIQANKRSVESRFGEVDVPFLLETVAVPVTITALDGKVCGFAAFSDAPPQWAGSGTSIGASMAAALPQSTLWTLAFASESLMEKKVAVEALRAAFIQCPEVDTVCLALPRAVPHNDSPFLRMFDEVKATPRGQTDSEGSVRIMSARRANIVPKLSIRAARVEDHDDLVPVFNRQSDLDKSVHEKFFLAGVIENQNAQNKAFVAESEGRAIGIACVSSEVQREELVDAFHDLAAFTGEQGETDKGSTVEGAGEQFLLSKAVCVTLFCLAREYHHRSIDFLKPMLDAFPDKDYVLLTQPFAAPATPLLDYFVQVPPRPQSNFGHVLYVLTRAAFFGPFEVRAAVEADFPKLKLLFQQQALLHPTMIPPPLSAMAPDEVASTAMKILEEAAASRGSSTAYVVFAGHSQVPVGAAVVDRLDPARVAECFDLYDLEAFIPGLPLRPGEEYGRLSLLCLDPKFQTRCRPLLGALLASPRSALLMEIGPRRQLAGPMLAHFFLAKARRQVEPWRGTTGAARPAMFLCTARLLRERKKCVNNRIVVVGASTVGLSVIDTLLTMHGAFFPHLTLISPEGIPRPEVHMSQADPSRPPAMALTCCYFRDELEASAADSRVRVAPALMEEINREEHVVFLNNDEAVSYDQLVLAVGQQPIVPAAVDGVFGAPASSEEAARIAEFLAALGRPASVVVYGASLSAATTIAFLLSLTPPDRSATATHITMVRPPSSPNDGELAWPANVGDGVLAQDVSAALAAAQVEVLEPFFLKQVVPSEETGVLSGVIIAREGQSGGMAASAPGAGGQQNTIPCDALIICGPKETNGQAFLAINQSCLVYDGRLVIDQHFATNDQAIFAAGSFTKYSRSLRDPSPMTTWNSREIGQQLAASVLNRTGHFGRSVPLPAPERIKCGTIRFRSPIAEGAVLPKGLFYFRVRVPSDPTAERGGRTISTKAPDGKSYISLHFNASGLFDNITYLGRERPDVDNLASMIGAPHTLFNSVTERMDAGLINDLPAFLREPWAQAIFHDRFHGFFDDLCGAMEHWLGPKAASDGLPLEGKALTAVEEHVASFISTNHHQLPQFAVPPSAV